MSFYYTIKALRKCKGFQLESLSRNNLSVVFSRKVKMISFSVLYILCWRVVHIWIGRYSIGRALSQSDDYFGSFACHDSRCSSFDHPMSDWKLCQTSNPAAVRQQFHPFDNNMGFNWMFCRLTGKLETTMCLILHSAIVTEKYENLNYFSVTRNVLQSYVHRYYTCSARYTFFLFPQLNISEIDVEIQLNSDRELQSCLVLRNAYKIFNLIQRHFSAEGKCRSPQGGQTWEDGMAMASLIQNKQIVCK